eukprot:SM000048S16548  [mRNA]  locus=s48:314943:320398:- [translate_table: standard]
MAMLAAPPSPLPPQTESYVVGLSENLALLNGHEVELAKMLVECGQSHLFAGWSPPDADVDRKHAFFKQIDKLDASYPNGLPAYINNARRLLADSRDGKNAFDGYTPSVPQGERLTYGDDLFIALEAAGVMEARNAAFVLVAGGLGERLGFRGIKVALPYETVTGTTFLQHYIESILALQERSNALAPGKDNQHQQIPFVIMTSDDTHARTQSLLEENKLFGMAQGQITLLKQEKVACLADNAGRLALDSDFKYIIQTKPHGHGDVHSLLFSSGLLPKWQNNGVKWVLFFQDTNGLLFKAIPASLGVSATHNYDVNSLAVPRKAKEAIGGIARLTHVDGQQIVINVEYNQLDPLLRATTFPDGDVNDATGFSPFPGNINQLVLKLNSYMEELSCTKGLIPEFVNPKYRDATRTAFKSSTRLECMMQDYPKTLSSHARVGFTVLDVWSGYSPVKNNAADAAAKATSGTPAHSATTGELDVYRANCLILRKAGVSVENPRLEEFNGQKVEVWPLVVWPPQWALTFADVKAKVSGDCRLSQRSVLSLQGADITLHDLKLDGALIVRAHVGAKVKVSGLHLQNQGWHLVPVASDDKEASEVIRIRGFRIERVEQRELQAFAGDDTVISQ